MNFTASPVSSYIPHWCASFSGWTIASVFGAASLAMSLHLAQYLETQKMFSVCFLTDSDVGTQFGESISFHEFYIMVSFPTWGSLFFLFTLFLFVGTLKRFWFFCHSFKIIYFYCVWHVPCCLCRVQRTTFEESILSFCL